MKKIILKATGEKLEAKDENLEIDGIIYYQTSKGNINCKEATLVL